MKQTGVVRQMDALGRFVLPSELRRKLDINENSMLEIYLRGEEYIVIENPEEGKEPSGITRALDNFGRIVIPMELRKRLDIQQQDPLEVLTDGDLILLKKYISTCVFCGSPDENIYFQGKNICKGCAAKVSQLKF